MAARSADVFPLTRFLLFLTLVFCIRQKCFITNDGISVTFLLENGVKQNETFAYSTLFVTRRKYGYPIHLLYLCYWLEMLKLTLALLFTMI